LSNNILIPAATKRVHNLSPHAIGVSTPYTT